ncbi:DUF3500 domain-containing protein [Nocardia asiatica]|uniref:DUF3500 domain-containing protein n=1 Tax=Nocardia asiatica TaxID=209252 RepID=UPI0002E0A505|nr:DUF3500 domain-containing protein [Nocardia asiatica]
MEAAFRAHLYPLDHPRLAAFRDYDARSYPERLREVNPILRDVLTAWRRELDEGEYRGITCDGTPRPDVFDTEGHENAPSAEALTAATALIDSLDEQTRAALVHPLDSKVWRAWMNPEMYVNRFGLRLEDIDAHARRRVLDLVKACLSPDGYEQFTALVHTNAFLGSLVDLPKLLNDASYNINIFGIPSPTDPWGWNFYGHHVCVNCLIFGDTMVLTPVFFGAEPNEMDTGKYAGTRLLEAQEVRGLALIRALSPELADQAILYGDQRDPEIPAARIHPGDELHLGGAFQDNRVIPYEGVCAGKFDAGQRDLLLELVETFLDYQPEGPRAARLDEIARYMDETWFCWIGGTDDDSTFYFRVQSPVIMVEFDHHSGMFLANPQPEKFHIHTLVRTPNGNDYGCELVRRATASAHLLNGPA